MDRAMQLVCRQCRRPNRSCCSSVSIRNCIDSNEITNGLVPFTGRFSAVQTRYFATVIEGSKPEDVMKQLLQKSSSWTLKEWKDSENILFSRMPITRDTIHWSFQLLDRMAREARQDTSSFLLTTKHVNQVVDRWRIGSRNRGVVDFKRWSATKVLKRLEGYAKQVSSLRLNTKTYSMIMAVQIKQNPPQSPSFCTEIIESMKLSTTAPPNAVALTYLMDAHVQSGQSTTVFAVQSIYDFLMERAYDDPNMMPTDKSLTKVLQAWVSLSDATVDEALPHMKRNIDFLLEAMRTKPEVLIDATFIDVVLEDCSKRGKRDIATPLADALLEYIMELAVDHPHLLPHPKTFSRIIILWRDSDLLYAAQRAEYWLDKMCQCWRQIKHFEEPRYTVYGFVIAAWAKSNHPDAAQRAEDVWRRLQQDLSIVTTGLTEIVISLWCRQYDAERAENILREILEAANNDPCLLPSTSAFVEVIQAWRNTSSKDAAARAHTIMETLVQYKRLYPDRYSDNMEVAPFQTCLELWAKSRNAEKSSQVETILTLMEEEGLPLSLNSLLPAISCLSASRATDLFAQSSTSRDDKDAALLEDIYEKLLEQWATNNETVSGEHAERLLKEFLTISSSRENLERVLRCFSHTIVAWKRSATNETPQKMKQLLERSSILAEEASRVTGNPSFVAMTAEIWARSGLPNSTERANYFFDKAMEQSDCHEMQTEAWWYENVISAFIECENENEASTFLQRARDCNAILTAKMYVPIIKFLLHGDAGLATATFLFEEMVDHFLEGNQLTKPTPDLFGLLIASHAKRKNTQEVSKLWRLLQRVQRSDPNDEAFRVDSTELFNLTSTVDSVGRDATILYHLLAESTPMGVSEKSVQCVMDALVESNDLGSGLRAEGILLKMQQLYDDGVVDMEPTFESFQKVIDSWVNSREEGNAERAEAILTLAENLADEGKQKLRPDPRGYYSVITAWSSSHDSDAPKRILNLIRKMKHRFDEGDHTFELNGSIYAALIQAYGNSGNPEAAKRAQRVFDETPDKWKDTQVYNAWIGAQGGDAISAESILQEMHRGYLEGNAKIQPNTETFNQVLQAWSRSGSPMAAWRVDGIFNRMNSLASTGALPVKPNARTFDMVIFTLSIALGADAPMKVERYLGLLKEFYRSGEPDCTPSIMSYTEAIRSWGANLDDPRSVLRAKALLDEMHELAREGASTVRPDSETYTVYLQALAKSASEQKAELAKDVADMMKSDGIVPQGHLLQSLQRCLLPSTAVLSGWTVLLDEKAASDNHFV